MDLININKNRDSCIFLGSPLTYGGEVVSLKRQPLLPATRFFILISVKIRVDPRAIVRLEGLGQLKRL
jgi:hypothetical protein